MLTLHFNDTTLDVQEEDSSYRYRSLMSKPQLVLKFSLPRFVEFPVGTWCEFQNERYTLNSPENIKKNGTRNIEYTLTLGTAQDNMGLYKMRNPVDKRLKWSLTATPREFVEALVWNMNDRDGAGLWKVGECIDAAQKTVEFNHAYVDAALQDIANAFETEWEIDDHTISLHKVEYFKTDPLPLSYGKGNGFVPGVGRTTREDEQPIKRLYVQGGDRNIDPSKYGAKELHLPKGQTLGYEGRTYQADADGYYIERTDKASTAVREDSLDCSEIYPSRVGEVTATVTEEGKDSDGKPFTFHDFIDSTIPETLNYNDCRIAGETATVVFQSGMLAGKEFEIEQTDKALTGYDHKTRRFKLVPQEIDGVMMPGGVYIPNVGDKYAVFGINLPEDYIHNDEEQTGAEWDMFREAARKLYENEDPKFTFTGTLQGLWAKKNWLRVGGQLKVGGYVLFSDDQFAPDGIPIRITGIKDFISSPYTPQLEISNSVSGKSLSSKLREIGQNEVATEDGIRNAVSYTKRRWRDARETVGMLQEAWKTNFSHFSESINPLTVETLYMILGDESLQFRFVESKTRLTPVGDNITYDQANKQLHVPHSFIQHMTLGIGNISSGHADSEYKVWEMAEYLSPTLADALAGKKYYLYAKVSSTDTDAEGTFSLEETPKNINAEEGYYLLLVGILNSEHDGDRSFVTLYGFTEVLPGRITTDRIVSGSGESWFDMLNNSLKLGNKLEYNTEASGSGNLLLRGGFIQTGSGEKTAIGAWCGEYDPNRVYQLGDEVYWTDADGTTSTYRYINSVASSGHAPDDDNYWAVVAAGVKGEDGTPGNDGADGKNGDYTSYVFKQSEDKPATPTGTDKIPDGWEDAPTAEGRWWMSKATISGQTDKATSEWSEPVQVTAEDGKSTFKSIVFKRTNATSVTTPAGGNYANPVPADWSDGIPDGDAQLWMSTRIFTSDGEPPQQDSWTTPRPATDTADIDFEFSEVPENPGNPTDNRGNWHNEATPNDIWMAVRKCRNGEWGKWKISKIKGEAGGYTDFKYAVNGSKSDAPAITRTSRNPGSAWHDDPPAPGDGEYLWMTCAEVNADDTLKSNWTDPVRISGENGKGIVSVKISYAVSSNGTDIPVAVWQDESEGIPATLPGQYLWTRTVTTYTDGTSSTSYSVSRHGSDGKDGKAGPSVVYRGEYDPKETYYGTSQRCDVVHYEQTAQYYIASPTAGTFSDKIPTNTQYWLPFGASFDSIATGLLLAEGANIGDWFIQGGKIVSTLGTNNKITLDAKNSLIQVDTANSAADQMVKEESESSRGAVIKIDAKRGVVETRSKTSGDVAYMSPSGIFANRAGTQALPASSGLTWRASIVGLGFADVNKGTWDVNRLDTMVMGVYGSASNSGTAMAVGGFFDKLYVQGLILHTRIVQNSDKATSVYLTSDQTMVIGYSSEHVTVYLPADPYIGQVVYFKHVWSGGMRVRPRTGHKIYDDHTPNEFIDYMEAEMGMMVFTIGYINDVKTEFWCSSRWKY